jgi:Mg-chelatase subunit ChlD
VVNVSQRVVPVGGNSCRNRDLFLVLDMSGSMANGGVRDVKIACQDIVDEILRPGDRVELSTFHSVIDPPLLALGRHSAADVKVALNRLTAQGMTSLWEAVINSVNRAAEVYQHGNRRYVEVVLLTDGDDTTRSARFEDACQKVAKPGCTFKFFMISCGSSPNTQQQLRELCKPLHCKLVIEDNVQQLIQAFGKIKMELVTRRVTEETFTKTTTNVQRRRL